MKTFFKKAKEAREKRNSKETDASPESVTPKGETTNEKVKTKVKSKN